LGVRDDNPSLLRKVMANDKCRCNTNIDAKVMEKLVKVLFGKEV
jgi:hypothetical protein